MRSNARSLRRNRRAASPAVSMVIITAATVVLVLVAGNYALQVIERQRASSEFESVTKSMLAFDDALRDIAWDREGSRAVRFTTNYGNVRLLPSSKSITINGPGGYSATNETGVVRYYMPTSQFTLGSDNSFYALGDNRTVVSTLADSFGQALVKQESGFATVTLNYRIRVSREGPATFIEPEGYINYVDILLIKLNCNSMTIGSGDFDLVAKNIDITTIPSGIYTVGSDDKVYVTLDGLTSDFSLGLDYGEKVIFNLIIAGVWVSP